MDYREYLTSKDNKQIVGDEKKVIRIIDMEETSFGYKMGTESSKFGKIMDLDSTHRKTCWCVHPVWLQIQIDEERIVSTVRKMVKYERTVHKNYTVYSYDLVDSDTGLTLYSFQMIN